MPREAQFRRRFHKWGSDFQISIVSFDYRNFKGVIVRGVSDRFSSN